MNPFSPHPPPSPGILETDIIFFLIFIIILTLYISDLLRGDLNFKGAWGEAVL